MKQFGQRNTLAIELAPLAGPPPDGDPAVQATWVAMKIWIEGQNVCAHTRLDSFSTHEDIFWPAAFLARWFLHVWPNFWERSGSPIPGPHLEPDRICERLDALVRDPDLDADDSLLEARDRFIESHSLLAAAGGGIMPHVYLMREHDWVHVIWKEPATFSVPVRFHAPSGRSRVSTIDFLSVVTDFLSWCASIVRPTAPQLARQVDNWLAMSRTSEAAIRTMRCYVQGWSEKPFLPQGEDLEKLLELPPDWASTGAGLDPGRFGLAMFFRAVAPVLPLADAQTILQRLKASTDRPEVRARLAGLRGELQMRDWGPPHRQGYALADQLRGHLGNLDRRFEVETFLGQLGIPCDEEDLCDPSIDAVSAWGEQLGPIILLNTRSVRIAPWAKRMTLAHELGHILVDAPMGAAAWYQASTPWSPPEIEKRANAFAAEMLLPRTGILRVAGAEVCGGAVSEATRQKLMMEFGVGETVCRHQLENHFRISDPEN